MLPFRSVLARLTDTFGTSIRTPEQTSTPGASATFCDLLLTSKEEFKLSQLSTSQLRQLCKHNGVIEASGDRSALLASIRADNTKYHWNVQNSQGFAPQRAWASLVSHDKDLYLYGGLPHHRVNQRSVNPNGTVFADDGESRMMKLDHNTNTWQAVSDEGAATETWYNWLMQDTGIVYKDTLYVVGMLEPATARQGAGEDGPDFCFNMRTFDFQTQRWTILPLEAAPRGYCNALLAAHDDRLLLYRGSDDHGVFVEAKEALWAFDIRDSSWKQCLATGDLPPDTELACGLTVFDGHGYLLVSEPDCDDCMDVYQLDLNSLHWQRLPRKGDMPFAICRARVVLVQDQWLVHAGVSENGGNAIKTLFIFDFNTLSWTNPDLTGSPLDYKFWHSATCHEGALVVMGGMGPEDAELCNGKDAVCMGVSSVQRVQRHHSSYTHDHQDTGIMRLGVRQASQASFRRHVFTDATIEVDGRVWAVHRATLACASPVFESMFSSNMLEGHTCALQMYDMTADTMGLLLDFLYGAPKPSLTFEEAADLFVVSDQYAIMELHLQCTRILKAMITMETVCMLTRLACDHLNTDLEQACDEYLDSLQEEALEQIDSSLDSDSNASSQSDNDSDSNISSQAGDYDILRTDATEPLHARGIAGRQADDATDAVDTSSSRVSAEQTPLASEAAGHQDTASSMSPIRLSMPNSTPQADTASSAADSDGQSSSSRLSPPATPSPRLLGQTTAETQSCDNSPGEAEAHANSPGEVEGQDNSPGEAEGRDNSPGEAEAHDNSPGEIEGNDSSPGEAEGHDNSPGEAEGHVDSPGSCCTRVSDANELTQQYAPSSSGADEVLQHAVEAPDMADSDQDDTGAATPEASRVAHDRRVQQGQVSNQYASMPTTSSHVTDCQSSSNSSGSSADSDAAPVMQARSSPDAKLSVKSCLQLGMGVTVIGCSLAVGATVMVGAATVSRIPRPKFPSFWK